MCFSEGASVKILSVKIISVPNKMMNLNEFECDSGAPIMSTHVWWIAIMAEQKLLVRFLGEPRGRISNLWLVI